MKISLSHHSDLDAPVRKTGRVTRLPVCLAIGVLLAASPRVVQARVPGFAAARLEVDASDPWGIGSVFKVRLLERGGQMLRDREIGTGHPTYWCARLYRNSLATSRGYLRGLFGRECR